MECECDNAYAIRLDHLYTLFLQSINFPIDSITEQLKIILGICTLSLLYHYMVLLWPTLSELVKAELSAIHWRGINKYIYILFISIYPRISSKEVSGPLRPGPVGPVVQTLQVR